MLKLLHLADIHLDSRFTGLSIEDSVKRRRDTRAVFSRALQYARAEGCKAVLISGDLFDSEYYTSDTLAFLCESFANMPDIRFIIAPGNHDPYNSTSPYRFTAFPDNVHVFDSEVLSPITIEELRLTVYGYAFTSQSYSKDPLSGFSSVTGNGFSVLCAHTELDNPVSSYAPVSTKALAASGFDYAALGHIHTKEEIMTFGSTVCAYSGCLAGRDPSEQGKKGGILVTLDEVNGKKTVTASRVRFCPWLYLTVTVDLSSAQNEENVPGLIRQRLLPYLNNTDTEYIIRLRLTGEVGYELNTRELYEKLSDYGVSEIKNETVFIYSMLSLEDDFTLRGEFYRTLKPKLTSDDPEVRRTALLALKIGLNALSGCDVDLKNGGV